MKQLINPYPPCPLAGCVILFRLVLCPTAYCSKLCVCLPRSLGEICRVFPPFGTLAVFWLPSLLGHLPSPVPQAPSPPSLSLLPARWSTQESFPRICSQRWAKLPTTTMHPPKQRKEKPSFLAAFPGYIFKRKMTHIDEKPAGECTNQMPSITGLLVLM